MQFENLAGLGPFILQGITGLITKGGLQRGYLEFYFAKQRAGLHPLSLNDQKKGTPPSSSVPPPI